MEGSINLFISPPHPWSDFLLVNAVSFLPKVLYSTLCYHDFTTNSLPYTIITMDQCFYEWDPILIVCMHTLMHTRDPVDDAIHSPINGFRLCHWSTSDENTAVLQQRQWIRRILFLSFSLNIDINNACFTQRLLCANIMRKKTQKAIEFEKVKLPHKIAYGKLFAAVKK